MGYIPNTDADKAAMLRAIGASSLDDLFKDIPANLRYPRLALASPLSEMEVLRELQEMSECNADVQHAPCFLGAGAYQHFVPSVVDHVLQRSEFYTAYTPYQPEISQGTLQAIFEYQSMICALTGLDAANASHYDGGTAVAEAAITAVSAGRGKRRKIVISPTVHPEYRAVVRTYTQGMGLQVVGDTYPTKDALSLTHWIDGDTAAVIVQNPDFLGELHQPEELQSLADATHAAGALLVVSVDPISLGLFVPPAAYGADIACGEGQALGGGLNFGGPYLGFFSCRKELVHRIAGRIVGETVDKNGQRGYVLTLSAREQHIRREKATSNICSNQALMALAAAVYLSAVGKSGLRHIAELCYHKAHYAASQLSSLPGYKVVTPGRFFKEFALLCPRPVDEINAYLLNEWGILGGYDLSADYPEMANTMLVCVTEVNPKADIDMLVEALDTMKEAA